MEEFDAKELSTRCRRCQKLVVSNVERAVNVLEEELQIKEFDVPDTTEINHKLFLAGIEIKESYLAGQDLEGYFMERIGS